MKRFRAVRRSKIGRLTSESGQSQSSAMSAPMSDFTQEMGQSACQLVPMNIIFGMFSPNGFETIKPAAAVKLARPGRIYHAKILEFRGWRRLVPVRLQDRCGGAILVVPESLARYHRRKRGGR